MKLRNWKETLNIPFKVGLIPHGSHPMTKEHHTNFQLELSILRLDLDSSENLPTQSCLQWRRNGWLRELIQCFFTVRLNGHRMFLVSLIHSLQRPRNPPPRAFVVVLARYLSKKYNLVITTSAGAKPRL